MDFPTRIRQLIDQAHATIVLIGKNWMPRRAQTAAQSGPSTHEPVPAHRDKDWVVAELQHSATSPIAYDQDNLYGLARRAIIPIFADCDRNFDQFDFPDVIANIANTQSESIDSASWPLAIGPLIDRIAVNLNLKKRPDKDEYPKPDAAKARTQPLSDPELMATSTTRTMRVGI